MQFLSLAKLHAYCLSRNAVVFIYSYFKRTKWVRTNNTDNLFETLLYGVPQRLMLGPILLNILWNDLFVNRKEAKLANFAGDYSIYAEGEEDIKTLQKLLE